MNTFILIWRSLVVLETLVVLGFTASIVWRYGLLSRKPTPIRDHFLAHVFYVALSYMVLLMVIVVDQTVRILNVAPLTYRLPLMTIVAQAGLIGITHLWEHVREEHQ